MFDSMSTFIEVVEAGSFSSASKKLNKNASSIARQIDKLEDELGAQLFNRSTRRLELTLSGQSFYQQSIEILRSLTQARDSVKADRLDIRGTIYISCLDSFGKNKVAPLLPEFRQMYPNTQAAIALDNNVVDLYQSHFDLAIRHGKPVDSSLIMKPILKDHTRLVATPDYLKSHPPLETPEDLKHHDCLSFHRLRQHTFWHFWHKESKQYQKVRINSALSSCGGEPLVNWAKEGLGITLMSEWMIEEELKSGQLVELLPHWKAGLNESDGDYIYMIWTPTRSQKPIVRAFIDFLSERLNYLA
jgi:DNA-binding transcriptional LysR family regulator